MQTDQLLTPTTDRNNKSSASSFCISKNQDNVDCITKAREICIDKKRKKMSKFLTKYRDNLEAHLGQMSAFACSINGLLEDEYREQ